MPGVSVHEICGIVSHFNLYYFSFVNDNLD